VAESLHPRPYLFKNILNFANWRIVRMRLTSGRGRRAKNKGRVSELKCNITQLSRQNKVNITVLLSESASPILLSSGVVIRSKTKQPRTIRKLRELASVKTG